MTKRLRLFYFRRTLTGALLAVALVLGLAGMTGLSSMDMASIFDADHASVALAQK